MSTILSKDLYVSRHPTLSYNKNDRIFVIGENEIVRVEERRSNTQLMVYVVQFKAGDPTTKNVDEAIDIMRIFKEIVWDFHLLADMRNANLMAQMGYIKSYFRLIGMIENPHCKHCYVYIKNLPPLIGTVITRTVEQIVTALSVPCQIVHN